MSTKPTKGELAIESYHKFIKLLTSFQLGYVAYALGDIDPSTLPNDLTHNMFVYGSFNRPLWIGCESTWHHFGVVKGTYAMLHPVNASWATMVPHSYIVSREAFPEAALSAHELVEIKPPDSLLKLTTPKFTLLSDVTVHSETDPQRIIEILLLEVRIDDPCILNPERVYAVRREDWCIGFVGAGGTYFNDDVISWTTHSDLKLALEEAGKHIDAELKKLSDMDE